MRGLCADVAVAFKHLLGSHSEEAEEWRQERPYAFQAHVLSGLITPIAKMRLESYN